MIETWKQIPGFPDYLVSNTGKVRSTDMEVKRGKGTSFKPGQILKPVDNGRGYLSVNLYAHKRRRGYQRYVHRLVAESWLPEFKEELKVNHKDLNKSNNCVDNLEMATNQENITHAVKNGKFHGDSNPNRAKRFSTQDIYVMEVLKIAGASTPEVGKVFGAGYRSIWAALQWRSKIAHRLFN